MATSVAALVACAAIAVAVGGAQRASNEPLASVADARDVGLGEGDGTRDDGTGDRRARGATTTSTSTYSGWVDVAATDGSYTMSLPQSWALSALDGGPAEVAARLLADDPAAAAATQLVSGLTTELAPGIAMDVGAWSAYGDGPVLLVERLAGVAPATAADVTWEAPPYAGQVAQSEGYLDGPTGRIVVLRTTVPSTSVPVYVYLVDAGGSTWSLTLWNSWDSVGNRIALSFATP